MKPTLPSAFLSIPLAHRGLHDVRAGRPENSRAAVRAAVLAGYGIEIDLQASKDGQAMVFHDYELARLTEADGRIRDRDARALSHIPLRGVDETIPTLPEVLSIVGGRVPLLIEIKDQDGAMGPDVGRLEKNVAAALEDYEGPVAVMSFNPHSIRCMAALCPEIPRGLVTDAFDAEAWRLPQDVCDHLRRIPDYEESECSFISHDWRDLDRPRVAELKAKGALVLCWTVKSPEQEARARNIAQNITFEQYLAPIPA